MISMRVNEIFNYLSKDLKEEELLKKCHQCMEIIVCAKDRQAAEANKNATILLEEIDQERSREESKRAAAARKREKKKQKKKEKQEQKEKTKDDNSCKLSSPELEDDEEDEKPSKNSNKIESKREPSLNNDHIESERNVSSHNGTKNKNKKNKKQSAEMAKRDAAPKQCTPPPDKPEEIPRTPATTNSASKKKNASQTPAKSVPIISTTGIGDLDDFGSLPSEPKSSSRTPLKSDKNHNQTSSHHEKTPHKADKSKVIDSLGAGLLSPKLHTISAKSPGAPSPKKGQRKEEGWKEVVRKSKKVSVPSTAISRVIGRGGCNINAIREVSGAHIEVDKAKGQGDRNITIKGSADATRQAHTLIMALIKDPDKDIEQLMPKKSKASPTLANGTPSTVAAPTSLPVSSIVSSALTAPKVTQPQKTQPPASLSNQRPVGTSKPSSTMTNSVMTNIGVFQAGPWGSVNLGAPATIPGLVRPAVSKPSKNPTLAKVVRQLFATEPSSTTAKTTVTYTSPSMAKTKLVTAASPSVSTKVDSCAVSSKPSVQTCISSASVAPQKPPAASVSPQPLPIKQPQPSGANHYSPFEDTLFSQVAERVLRKDEAADSRLNFATVAAAGVVSTTQASMLPGASTIGEDPRLQAKAPGYKAPRTNSPQVSDADKFKQPHPQRMAYMPTAEANYRGMPPVMPPPSIDTYDKGYRPDGTPQMSPHSANSTPVHAQSPMLDGAHREEYTTPSQPMTLPRIESNLNPNAPDFTTRPPMLPSMRMPYMNMRHSQNIAELAQLAMGRGALNDLTQQNIVALAAFQMSQPDSMPPPQFSPAANLKTNAAPSPNGPVGGNSPKAEEESVHHSTGSASPLSSSAPSPTDQARLMAASDGRSLHCLQPIGTERSSKKPVPPAGVGPLGFGLRNDVGASGSLWSMTGDMAGSDWLSTSTPPLVTSATVTTTVASSVHMTETMPPPRSMMHMDHMADQGAGAAPPDPSMHPSLMGSSGTAFANGLPPAMAPFVTPSSLQHLWNTGQSPMKQQQPVQKDVAPDAKMMWNSWTPPPNM